MARARLTFHPLTPDRWSDFQALFGERGACGGCWCMFWRLTRAGFDAKKGAGNRRAMRRIVESGETPGILAYEGDRAVGWCAVAPRESLPALGRSRILRPVDEAPVWSVSCFFVDRGHRRRGLTVALLKEAIRFVRSRGGCILEGYPTEPRTGKATDAFVWTGLASAFRAAGFVECARRSETRPIMRYAVRAARRRPEAGRGVGRK